MPGPCGEIRGDEIAGLIIADGTGRYFVISIADLDRFRVPDRWCAALEAFTNGAEPAAALPDVAGFGGAEMEAGTWALIERELTQGASAHLPVRRLAAWAVLP